MDKTVRIIGNVLESHIFLKSTWVKQEYKEDRGGLNVHTLS